MDISMFDIIDDSINNDAIVSTAISLLHEKYNKNFSVQRIGNRYGGETNDFVTLYCSPEDNKNLVFLIKLNKDKELVEDDYMMKSISYQLEKGILDEFEKHHINIIVKSEIIGINKVNEIIDIQDLINKYKDISFLVYIICKDNIEEQDLKSIYEELNKKYDNLFLKSFIYIIEEDNYKICYENTKTLPTVTNSIIQKYNVKNKRIIRINNGKIEEI